MDSTEMKKWVMSHQVPLLPPFNEKYQSIIFDSGVEKHVFVVADPPTLKDTNAMNVSSTRLGRDGLPRGGFESGLECCGCRASLASLGLCGRL